jgi:hypothetical protein
LPPVPNLIFLLQSTSVHVFALIPSFLMNKLLSVLHAI